MSIKFTYNDRFGLLPVGAFMGIIAVEVHGSSNNDPHKLIGNDSIDSYFLTMIPSLCFGMIMYMLWHYMLGICDLFFILIL